MIDSHDNKSSQQNQVQTSGNSQVTDYQKVKLTSGNSQVTDYQKVKLTSGIIKKSN